MFFLDEPYVSDFLIETIKKNNYKVIKSAAVSDVGFVFTDETEISKQFSEIKKVYTNSENSIQKITQTLKNTNIPSYIEKFKDKVKFREILKEIYPEFFFKKASFEKLDDLNPLDFKYPFVIKPAIGFLSFGVYTVFTPDELKDVVNKIKDSMDKTKGIFPKEVLDSNYFIIEEFIEGDEYAVDVYYDEDSNPVILNIFQHPFADKNDVSDRMYITSSDIILKNLKAFNNLFGKIGKIAGLKNFPMHIELRKDKEKIIPIEINPLRFAGWCLTDLAYFAYGINVYEYFMENKKPNFEQIFANNNSTYAFVIADVPFDVDKNKIASFDIEGFKKDTKAVVLETRTFDFKTKPLFCTLFIKTDNYDEIKHILKLDMKKYINFIC